jgi:hypothetical protein
MKKLTLGYMDNIMTGTLTAGRKIPARADWCAEHPKEFGHG